MGPTLHMATTTHAGSTPMFICVERIGNHTDQEGTEILVLNGYDAEGPVHYALYDDISQELLDVNSVNGSVKLKKSLDREVNPHHEVIFSVVDNMGQQQPMETSIYVLDVNDNAPVFENTPYKVSISENVTVGTTIFEISATDSDSGRNGIIFFSFSTEINSFSIPSPNRYVIINQPLDYEDINIYELTIVATDQGIPQQSSEASLIIKVTDVQDNPPMFTGLPYTTSVDENSPTTLVVQTVRAFDQDIGLSNQISYSIVSASVPELFTINADTGEIRGQRLIDREAEGFPGYVTLTVEALEVGPDGGDSAQTEFTITINDVNDESPLFSQAEYSITVSENAHIALPLDIHVRDRDQGEFSTISLSLHGQYSELFRLEPSRVLGEADVIILVDHPLDYETAVQYQLYIYANETADITHFDMTRVRITLINENDNRPIFSSQSITVDVKEDLPVGSNVTMVTATDDDIGIYGDITYTISGADQFIIDAELGVISLIQSIDYELSLRYQLTVRAEDGGNPAEADNTRVIINVIDVNDNPPVFKDSEYFATIEENTVYLNKSIVRIRATDRDSAPYNQITYHILDAPSEDQFSVTTDGVNGFVFVNTPVDYEELIDGGLTLTLSAEDLDGLSDVAVLYIEVLDKNDHGPEFTHQTYNVSVFEDIQTSDTVTTVTAIDGDMSSALGTESIVYSVSQPGVFRINPGTGEITTTTFLDRDMGVDSYIVQVLAVDGGHGNEQKTATSMVYITILDVNDNNPVFENVRQTVYIAEDQPIDTVIGNVTASDLDFGMNGDIIYSFISGNTDDVFSIGLFDGEILIKKELDYDDLYQVYILEILAHDQGVPVDPATGSATATVTVSVIDVNDNSPVFEYTVYQFAVSEEADPGITIGMIRATDMDSTTNAYIDYNITDGNIDGSFNMKRVGSGEIILERQLDRENIDMYGLTVIASDRGIPRHSAVCYVTIIVRDVNDNDPIWIDEPYMTTISEDVDNGTYVFQVSAIDADIGSNQLLVYEINPFTPYFKVDSASGVITTTDVPLDREMNTAQEIILTVKDSGRPLRRSSHSAIVHVTVLDINDNVPVFEDTPYIGSVVENQPAGTSVIQVSASDLDFGENGTVSYFIVSLEPNTNNFDMNSSTGLITLTHPLDREYIQAYNITIQARDGGMDPNVAIATVQIEIEDDNDHSPLFTANSYEVSVLENATRGTSLIVLSASDGDIGTNADINYFITHGNQDGKFQIHFQSGLVQTSAFLDREVVEEYNLTIEAIDNGVYAKTGTCYVTVNVLDINDNRPIFTESNYDVTVMENVTQDYTIVTVHALDADIGENAKITYAIIAGNTQNSFVIDSNYGDIRRNEQPLDRETEESYILTVEASNNDSNMFRSQVRVSMMVYDVNDEKPVFTQSVYYRPDLSESAGKGTSVILVSAEDPDLSDGGRVVYSITAGNDMDEFSIDSSTGLITTDAALDYETKNNYSLVVMAVDQSPPYHSGTASVVVIIVNINDEPPSFNQTRYYSTVKENVAIGTSVVKVTAVEYDNQNPIQYEFDPNTNPEAMALFTINIDNGLISTINEIDREIRGFYTITVLANDGGTEKGSTTVWITVLDKNDNAPSFDVFSDISVSVKEEMYTPVGSMIGRVKATDRDEGINAMVNYEIIDGDVNNMFNITTNTVNEGIIKNIQLLDREVKDTYRLIVSAYDSGDVPLNTSMIVTINIEDVNDNIPNVGGGTIITTVYATDEDIGSNGVLKYYIVDGNTDGTFRMDRNTGEISTRPDPPDREKQDFYNLTVLAEDEGDDVIQQVTVTVLDINDIVPYFDASFLGVYEIAEDTSGPFIGTFRATDLDEGNNGHIQYSLYGDIYDEFSISPSDGDLRVRRGVELDRERIDIYNITLIATDMGNPPLSGSLDRETTSMYILTVTAKDNPENPTNARRDGTELIVTLLDENDQIPTFTQSLYSGHIEENSQEDNTVTMDDAVLAVDADFGNNSVITYSISGNGSQYFYIHQHTATIHVKETNSLDREAENIYRFLVTAIDIGGLNSSAEIVVNIVDVNDNSPVFTPSNMTVFIPENVVGGHVVMEVLAIDADIGLNQEVTYRVESGGQDKFTINPNTGLIKVSIASTLDREQRDQYTLVVIATDRGNPSQSGTGTVSIIVGDINDTPPSFTVLSQNFYLRENSPVGTTAAWVIAVDPDFDSLLQYSIVSIAAIDEEDNIVADSNLYENWFSINEFSGTVQVAGILDRENVSVFQLTISAVDLSSQYNGSRHSNPNAEVSIHLLDVNDNDPVFQPPGLEYIHEQLVEQSPLDTVVTTFTALDRDKGLQGMVRYEIVDNKTDLLQISDPAVGVITVNGVVDREIYQWLNFTVKAWDFGNPPRYSQIPVFVEILELNDNNPIFRQSLYETSVVENAIAGTEILVVIATDADSGSYGEVRYMLAGGAGKFTVDEITGAISLVHSLDREIQSEYTLTVTAKDNPTGLSSDRRENSVLVIVDVLDVNDNVPIPGAANYRFEILENVPVYSAVGTVVAHDADSGANGVLQYIISEVSEDDLFDINSSDGQIFTINSLDRESLGNKEMVSMVVKIQDQGVEHHEVTVPVLITVLDVNDNSPYFAYAMYNVTLSEDDFGGTLVYQFSAVDLDQDPVITYTLLDADLYSEFTVSEQTGALTTVSSLDHESRPEYLLTIEASDEDGNVGTTQLYIRVLDTNDQAPLFAITLYQFSVKENESVGSLVGQVVATDSDSVMEHSKIFYHIINGNPDNDFYLNENTGVVLINKQLNRESRAMYELEIEARNVADGIQSNVTLYDLATVIISIEDINDEAPMFTKQQYSRRILENEQIDTSIITVTAVDFDDGTNGEVYYAIEEGNYNVYVKKLVAVVSCNTNQEPGYFITTVIATDGDLGDNGVVIYDFFKTEGDNEDWQNFYIDETRGDLYTTFTADRELKSFYTIVLLAKDLGEPQFESTQAVTIKVLDENDNIPIFSNVEVAQTMYISEHSTNGTIVGEIEQAIDLDEGDNAKVYYYFAGGNSDGYFEIDKTTGIIILMKEVDREKVNQFVLTVKASSDPDFGEDIEERRRREVIEPIDMNDINDPTLKTVVIKVVDINDNGPQFPRDEYTAGLSLDAKYESKLITVTAKDEDTGNNSIVYYSILSIYHLDTTTDLPPRVQPNAFKIGRLDGIIRTNELFVSFYHGYFELNVLAEDNGHKNDTAIVKIYMLKDNQRVKIVFNNDPDTVKEFTDQFISLIANITGALVHVDDIQYHISDTGGVDFKRTDMLIHAVDPNTNSIMDVHHIIELIDANYADLENFFKVYNVIEIVPAVPSREEDRISLLEAALVAIGIMLFIGVLIYIFCICWIRHKAE
ncbi:LOW QUALITY PROTEIN: cadherin-23 [Saccoglossus kowalevskii]